MNGKRATSKGAKRAVRKALPPSDAAHLVAELEQIFVTRGMRPAGLLVRWASSGDRFLAAIGQLLDSKSKARPPRDYGMLRLEERWFDLGPALVRLAATLAGGSSGKGFPFGAFHPASSIGRRRPNYSSNLTEWCEWWLELRSNDPRGTVTAPSEPAAAQGLPPFETCDRAIDDWLLGEAPRRSGRSQHLGEFVLVVTDRRGRLDSVRWEGRTLAAGVQTEREPEKLELQCVLETDEGRVVLPPLRPAPASHQWTVPEGARAADLYLVHESGDLLGTTSVTPGAQVRMQAEVPVSDQAALDLANGENDRVEFKPFLEKGDEKWWEVAETIVAFANTYGGRLYLGVRNGGEPEGEKAFDRVLKAGGPERDKAYLAYADELIRTRVKPVPQFQLSRASHLGQPLLVVLVQPGADKPYSTAMDEVLIRKGATNKRPDPQTELRHLYENRTPLWGSSDGILG